jgi:prepilin-type N-terminal cleavage/methylation domain-containing protein
MKTANHKKGFTLVELMVVMSIIALLSSVVFLALRNARIKARDAHRLAVVRELNTVLSLYESDKGTSTITGAGLGGVGYGPVAPNDGSNPSIIRQLKNLGYASNENIFDPIFGDYTYYLGVCESGGQYVYAKVEQTALANDSATISGSCGGTGALASGYNYVSGAGGSQGGGIPAGTSTLGGVPLTATVVGQLPSARRYHSCTTVAGNVYCFGGRNDDPLNQAIRFVPSTNAVSILPSTLANSNNLLGCATVGSKAYCLGGHDGTVALNSISVFDSSGNTIAASGATLPANRDAQACAAASNGKIYCFGGYVGGPSASIISYDPAGNTVATLGASLPSARYGLSCAAAGTKIYCFGGQGPSCGYTDEIDVFDPVAGTLTALSAKVPTPRSFLACAALSTGKIGCAGGSDGSTLRSDVFTFDPTGNVVTPSLSVLPSARDALACAGGGSGEMYCSGGFNGSSAISEILKIIP